MNRKDVPDRHLRLYDRALAGKSLRAGASAHCTMCMGWQAAEVPRCTAPGCPLYPYRPGVRQPKPPDLRSPEAKAAAKAKMARATAAKLARPA